MIIDFAVQYVGILKVVTVLKWERSLVQLKDGKNKLDWEESLISFTDPTKKYFYSLSILCFDLWLIYVPLLSQHQVSLSDNDRTNLQAFLEAIIDKLKYDESYNFSEPVVIIVVVMSSLDYAPYIFVPRVKMKLHSLSIESSSKCYWTTLHSWCEFLIVSCFNLVITATL